MIPFLEKIAKRLLKKYPKNMDKIAVVLPSKRSVVFLKNYLSKKITKPIFLPEFFSIEEFIENISGLRVIDNVSLQFYLYNSYLKVSNSNSDKFLDFLNWSNIMLQDFNDIDTNMVDAKSLFTNIKNVKELENWEVNQWSLSNENLTKNQIDYIEFFNSLFYIYENFKSSLSEYNYAFQGMANLAAAKKIADLKIEWERVWFVGLNALTKSQHLIIDDLKQRNIARVFWDADKYYFDNEEHEASFFLKEQRDKWKEIDFEGIGDYLSKPKEKFQIISCPQNIAQAQALSLVLSNLDAEDLLNSKTAIILADEGLLLPVLKNIPEKVGDLNITMGTQFKKTPFFSFISSFLNLVINSVKNKNEGCYYKDLFLFLEDPYFKKISSSIKINNLKKFVFENNLIFITYDQIMQFLSKEKFKGFFKFSSDTQIVLEKIKSLSSLIKKSSIENNNKLDIEISITFDKSIEVVERLLNDFPFATNIKTLSALIEKVISNEIIPFKGEPLQGLQLMGILESRALDFKNVIILGVNEGILPKGKESNSLIPFDLKKYYKIPTYSERDAIFSYHFYRILQRAKNVTLIYNSSINDFGVGEKSRFITQLISEYKSSTIEEYVFHDNNFKIQDKELNIISNLNFDNEINHWGKKGVSPTSLNMYKKCSLEFYFSYLLNIKEGNQIDEFADSGLMGSAVHFAMQKFYKENTLQLSNFHNSKKRIQNLLEDFYKDSLSSKNYNKGKNYLSLKVAESLVFDAISYEEKLIRDGNKIQILYKEKQFEYNFPIDNFNFKLIGNIDRIDLFNDELRIIDYKTGKTTTKNELEFSDWSEIIENPKKDKLFQLLMYTYLFLKNNNEYLNKDIITGIYFLRKIHKGLTTIQKKDGLILDDVFISEFENQLKILFRRIINDDFKENEDDKLCQFCNHLEIFD